MQREDDDGPSEVTQLCNDCTRVLARQVGGLPSLSCVASGKYACDIDAWSREDETTIVCVTCERHVRDCRSPVERSISLHVMCSSGVHAVFMREGLCLQRVLAYHTWMSGR